MKRLTALGLILVLAAAFLAGCTPKELRTVKIEMGPINKPRANADMERVKRNLEDAVKLYPNNAEVYQYLGRVHALEGKYPEMAAALAKSDSLDPKLKIDNDTIRQNKWKELFEKGKQQATNKELEAALESFKNSAICWPERYESWINAAVVAHQLNQSKEAFTLSKKAFDLAPDTMVVAENYATMCMADSQYDAAKTVYLRLIEKDPTNAEIMFQLGNICRINKDIECAVRYYSKALEIDKGNAAGWFDLGMLYYQMDDYCRASEHFKKVVALLPEDKDAKFNYFLSLLKCAQGDTAAANAARTKTMFEEAKIGLEKFTAEYPDNCEAWNLLSNSCLWLKMKKEAETAFKKYQDCGKAK